MNVYDVGIVSYGSAKIVIVALESVLAQRPAPVRCVVVENSQAKQHWDVWKGVIARWGIPESFQGGKGDSVSEGLRLMVEGVEVLILRSLKNGGFCAGNNVALWWSGSRYYLSVNPDCELLPGAFGLLDAAFDESTAVVSGVLLQSRAHHDPHKHIDSAGGLVSKLTGRTTILTRPPSRAADYAPTSQILTYAGACALFQRTLLMNAGGFPDQFFLFYDEAYLSHTFRETGFKVVLIPSVVGYHARHSTTRSCSHQRSKVEIFHASRSSILLARRLGWRRQVLWTLARIAWSLRLLPGSPGDSLTALRGVLAGWRGSSE